MRRKSERIRQLEADNRFRREGDLSVIPRESGTRSPGTGSSQGTDRSAFAATSQAADQGACACAAADESSSALAFTRRLLTIDARSNRIAYAVNRDRRERNAEARRAFEFARGLGIGHRAAHR